MRDADEYRCPAVSDAGRRCHLYTPHGDVRHAHAWRDIDPHRHRSSKRLLPPLQLVRWVDGGPEQAEEWHDGLARSLPWGAFER